MSLERISTVITTTAAIAYRCPTACFSIHLPRPVSFSAISTAKNRSPQHTYVHSAPCHRPVSAHTTSMLKARRHLLFTRLPPRGKNT